MTGLSDPASSPEQINISSKEENRLPFSLQKFLRRVNVSLWKVQNSRFRQKPTEYLTISYGKNYKDAKEPRYVTPIALVVSARVSYTQFWKESGNFEKYCKERMKNARKLARSRRHKDYFNECWDYVEFCGERLNLSVSYEKQKDYIKNLYKNEDYMTLERVFRPYFKMMQKSLQKNELFAEDEEIFDIYVDVLEKTGKTVQRSKIGTLI